MKANSMTRDETTVMTQKIAKEIVKNKVKNAKAQAKGNDTQA